MEPMEKKREQNLSDQLRAIVAGAAESQADIARNAGIDETALSRFLSGERFVSETNLDKLGRYFGLRIAKGRRGGR
jgi:transcriptional regulator with XRE-family HTH domain